MVGSDSPPNSEVLSSSRFSTQEVHHQHFSFLMSNLFDSFSVNASKSLNLNYQKADKKFLVCKISRKISSKPYHIQN